MPGILLLANQFVKRLRHMIAAYAFYRTQTRESRIPLGFPTFRTKGQM